VARHPTTPNFLFCSCHNPATILSGEKISGVDIRDIAAVAAAALTQDGHEGKTYDLTGPEALTHGDMAEKLSKAVGREIQYVDVPEEAMMGALLSVGLPHWQVDGLIEDYAHYRRGEASSSLQGFTMRPVCSQSLLTTSHATTRRPFLVEGRNVEADLGESRSVNRPKRSSSLRRR
jgi:hypothetical protein